MATAPSAPGAVGETDGAILARSVVDPKTFELLYERHHDAIHRYVAARVGIERAEDLVADVFVAAFDSRAKFGRDKGDDALPWLFGITTRRIGRARDAERRWLRDIASGAAIIDRAEASEGVASRVDAQRLAPVLVQALAALRPRDREPLLLHVLGGLSYEEVATSLALPIGTVRSRIARARTRLAGCLDREKP